MKAKNNIVRYTLLLLSLAGIAVGVYTLAYKDPMEERKQAKKIVRKKKPGVERKHRKGKTRRNKKRKKRKKMPERVKRQSPPNRTTRR